MLGFRFVCLATILLAGCSMLAHAQCASVYTSMAPDGAGHMHAVTIITDNYTNPIANCAPGGWGTNFKHTYGTSLTIYAPSGRQSSASGSNYQYGNTGTATTRLDDYLDLQGEGGTWVLGGLDTINCSIVGLFFSQVLQTSYDQPQPVISSIVDSQTNKNSIPIYAQGKFIVTGTALTAGGVTPMPILDASDDASISLSLLSSPTPIDARLYISYGTIGAGARVGAHSLGLTTAGGHASGAFTVVPDARVTPGPITIMGYKSGLPDTRVPDITTTCTHVGAAGDPGGGTFSWSSTSSAVTLTNANSAIVTICSVSGAYSQTPGDVAVNVTYLVGGAQSPAATTTLTVLMPVVLLPPTIDQLLSSGHTCIGTLGDPSGLSFTAASSYYQDTLAGATYSSYVRSRQYNIRGTPQQIIPLNMYLYETYTPPGLRVSVGSGYGYAATDFFVYCSQKCRLGQADSTSGTQSIYANNVLIATKSNISWTCTDAIVP